MTQTIINLGTAGGLLNGQNGSTAGADTNDARFLDWPGDNAGNYVYLPGVGGNYLNVPDEAALDITGDIDLRVYLAADVYVPGTTRGLLSKYDASGDQKSYSFRILADGKLRFQWSENGSADLTADSSVAVGLDNFSLRWLRVTVDVDNGASGRDVRFFLSVDGSVWTQLGSTVTQAGVTTIFSGSASVDIGSLASGVSPLPMKVYRAQVLDGIDGTVVLDVDTSVISSGSATSFTALTGQTVTIDRSTSGRKSVAVVSPVWLFGTDDYMEVADNDLLDFESTDDFTVFAVYRPWDNFAANVAHIAKKANTTTVTQGWLLGSAGISIPLLPRMQIGDGSAGIAALGSSRTSGDLIVAAGVRDIASDAVTVFMNAAAGTAVTDTTAGSLANSDAMRIGRLSGAGSNYANMELVAAAVFRRALTPAEIAQVTAYYQARLS
jgi:hypothetical protein